MDTSLQPGVDDPHVGHGHGHGHAHSGPLARLRHALVPHSHDHSEAIRTAEEASAVGIRASWVSLAGMGATAVLQLLIVWLSGSVALLADTLHNLGHLATTIPLIIAFRLGRRPATRRYSHGFRRAEDLVGLLIGLVVALSAVLIVWESVRALSAERDMTHLGWVLAAALVGAAGNEVVAIYRIRAGRRIGSAALVAEGQHARTDALTSLAVVIGVVGAWVGLPWVDPVVGLVIAAVIVAVLVSSMRTVVRRLMDGVEPDTLDLLEVEAARVPGVVAVDAARARWTGHRLEADIEIMVGSDLTLSRGIDVARAVDEQLRTRVPHLERAAVRIVAAVRSAQEEDTAPVPPG
ncbi:cation diffusion facilitator family transporter [Georgenia satyanarayanai]|uniref:Cation diffusion facilitator family transporter n=1 Tax=Georgenia satyanarayanai TaxID=860221 RepID=A0A2Y9AH57_9MICO|nr:cation diffusion facilitator family transporter [Georgenia satyanarayanai]PYF99198.1 cation diffusion facilitator family transporter [Georgenia satyanarayanai]SSA43316.1 cation diffusion facilitator family transporter [Georgenia satyanarayanai]